MINFQGQLRKQVGLPIAEKHVINNAAEKTKPLFERSYPPIGRMDTVKFVDGKQVSVHGTADFFKDNEIIQIRMRSLPPPKSNENPNKFPIAKTKSGRTVLQQQATRGCTEGCVEMLKADNGKKVDFQSMRNCNLGNDESMTGALQKSGLIPLVSYVSFEHLQNAIEKHGSAIISVDDIDLGGHVVMLDKIDYKEKAAYIRDPYHGWAIVVKLDAFKERVGNGDAKLIQVQAKK